jgi:hypothetical protein
VWGHSGSILRIDKALRIRWSSQQDSIPFPNIFPDQRLYSIECILYLWAMKIWYPDSLWLMNGSGMAMHLAAFNFKLWCKHSYSDRVYVACLESFYTLQFADYTPSDWYAINLLEGCDGFHKGWNEEWGNLRRPCSHARIGKLLDRDYVWVVTQTMVSFENLALWAVHILLTYKVYPGFWGRKFPRLAPQRIDD